MSFSGLRPPFARALAERSYTDPTAVQAAVLAPEVQGEDLLVSAQTGSGKTIAFGLAIGATLLGAEETLARAADPAALIIAPTRELALQVQRELTWLYEHTGAVIVACVGGMDPREERRALNRGCHIVVGTPGRLRDHLERGSLRLGALKAVVLDEADEMFDLGFREDLEFLLAATPADRRTLLFSATLPKEIIALTKQFQRNAQRIATQTGERAHADIEYRVVRVSAQDTEHAVVNLLRYHAAPGALVFCNTREAVRHLHATLVERGFAAVSLSGEFSQNERNHALQALRDGKATVCVATDVAARGIDLPSLTLVIHADIPTNAETLQHRSGRTGRAGRKGISILLVIPQRRRKAEMLLKSMRINAAWGNPPSAEDIRRLDSERLLEGLLKAEAGDAEDLRLGEELLARRPAAEIAAALVHIHRARLPAPEEIADVPEKPRWEPRTDREHGGREHGGREFGKRVFGQREPRGDGPGHPKSHPKSDVRAEGPMSWFRLNIGRDKKADPKWLIPEICKQGGVTKREIGAIRIFDTETKFEITEAAAAAFADKAAQYTEGDIRISPAGAPTGGKKPFGPKPFDKKPFGKKPFDKKPGDKKPFDPKFKKGAFKKKHFGKGGDKPLSKKKPG